VSDKETSVTPSELYDLPKSKGSANLVQKVTLPLLGLYLNGMVQSELKEMLHSDEGIGMSSRRVGCHSGFVRELCFANNRRVSHRNKSCNELDDIVLQCLLFSVQCKFCDKVGNVTVIPGRDKPYTLEDSESGKFVPIGCFDSRGIEPTEFSFRDSWVAEGVSIGD